MRRDREFQIRVAEKQMIYVISRNKIIVVRTIKAGENNTAGQSYSNKLVRGTVTDRTRVHAGFSVIVFIFHRQAQPPHMTDSDTSAAAFLHTPSYTALYEVMNRF